MAEFTVQAASALDVQLWVGCFGQRSTIAAIVVSDTSFLSLWCDEDCGNCCYSWCCLEKNVEVWTEEKGMATSKSVSG